MNEGGSPSVTCVLCTGVKEAFLKVAQGVITLHQHNQLHRVAVDSFTQGTVSRTFNAVPDPEPTDNVHVHTNTASNGGFLSRCCS